MEILKKLRKNKKITQTEIANFLNISYQAYAHYETGRRNPDPNTLQKLADFFDVSVDFLLGRDEKKSSYFENTLSKNNTSLTDEEKKLIDYYRQLNENKKALVMEIAKLSIKDIQNTGKNA